MITEAVAAVVAAIEAADIDRGDTEPFTVTGFMPLPGNVDRPAAAAVYFDGMDPENFGVTVAAIFDVGSGIPGTETLMQTIIPAIDTALDAVSEAPRSTWSRAYSPDYGYIYSTTLAYPRDDF